MEPAEEARTVAETIAQLTGLLETKGAVEEGFWAVRTLFARLAQDRPLVVGAQRRPVGAADLLALIENVARHSASVPPI